MRIKKVNMILTKRKKYSILFLLMLSLTGCNRIPSDPGRGSGTSDLTTNTQDQTESDIRR